MQLILILFVNLSALFTLVQYTEVHYIIYINIFCFKAVLLILMDCLCITPQPCLLQAIVNIFTEDIIL